MPADEPAAPYARDRVLVPVVAALSLVAAFAVAQWSGVRVSGLMVLVAGGAWCAMRLLRGWGGPRTAVVAVTYTAAFVLSHPLGTVIGAWPAVFIVAIATAAVAYAVMRPTGRSVSTTSPPTSSTR